MPAPAAPLCALLPPRPAAGGAPADDILSRFIQYVASTGLDLYPAQEEAILELLAGKHVVLGTPTGSGKSLVAVALLFKAMAEGRRSFYTCPIKALVNEKFFGLCQAFGADNVGMMTGDAAINRDAPVICCTAEILATLALREARLPADYVVMDEFHYYGDRERGVAWQIPLLTLRETTFLLMSATLGDTRDIAAHLRELTGREVATVESRVRPVPLDFEYRETPLCDTIAELVEQRRHPIYLVNFTQRAAAEQAQNLMSVNVCTKEEKDAIGRALADVRFDTPYGKEVQKLVRHGLGLHHAGLLPKYRLLIEKLAQAGHLKIISGTDTLGVGVNIPIRTVLFTQLCKFDGRKTGLLGVREFLQIAGRAGRKGFDDRGWVVAQAPEHVTENRRLAAKQAAGKKVVMQKPPQKGYVHWDRGTFERLVDGTPERLESRFEVTHGLLLSVLQSAPEGARGGGYRRLLELCARSHGSGHLRRQHKRVAAERFRTLRRAGVIEVRPADRHGNARVEVSPGLQRDFSLNHTLALYLLDTLPRLDPGAETGALDLLTLVESILENPNPVLYAQVDRLKTERMGELKAAGVEYAERMEELDKIEWPKPLRDFIYDSFNAFAEKHPWVGEENIRPKSVARDIVERCASFEDYIREYDLQRVEGILLRYLSDAWKTLVRSVPESYRTDEVEDVIASLAAIVRRVDSSLLDEWERMRDPEAAIERARAAAGAGGSGPSAPEAAARPRDPAADPRTFAARIRAEMHALLGTVARKRWEQATALVHDPGGEWTPARVEGELAPYWAEHSAIVTTPLARRPSSTVIRQVATRVWEVAQRIVDPEGDEDWAIHAVVDLTEPRAADTPLLALRRIGV